MHDSNSPSATATALGKQTLETHWTYHDPEGGETLSETVAAALEAAADESDAPTEPLYHSIDPDALNALFRPTHTGPDRDSGRVSFSVGDLAVTVRASGRVSVRRTD